MKKKLTGILAFMSLLLAFAGGAYAEDRYVPLRKTFEDMGYNVSWFSETPNSIFVNIGDYKLEFTNGKNDISVDDGIFTTEKDTYIDNGVTYMSSEAAELAGDLYLYHNAIVDAVQADEDEILPLRPIDKTADKVLVGVWNKYPNSYPTGEKITISYGDVWVFTADEMFEWGQKNGRSDDMVLRMEQLIGLPPQNGKTHFTLLWVDPDDLYRPSADRSIDTDKAVLDFPENTESEYIEWFKKNMESSYNPHKYPWTRLGYTYDWADNGTEYGLSEYILKNGSEATVERTYTNEEFFDAITSVDDSNEYESEDI